MGWEGRSPTGCCRLPSVDAFEAQEIKETGNEEDLHYGRKAEQEILREEADDLGDPAFHQKIEAEIVDFPQAPP